MYLAKLSTTTKKMKKKNCTPPQIVYILLLVCQPPPIPYPIPSLCSTNLHGLNPKCLHFDEVHQKVNPVPFFSFQFSVFSKRHSNSFRCNRACSCNMPNLKFSAPKFPQEVSSCTNAFLTEKLARLKGKEIYICMYILHCDFI